MKKLRLKILIVSLVIVGVSAGKSVLAADQIGTTTNERDRGLAALGFVKEGDRYIKRFPAVPASEAGKLRSAERTDKLPQQSSTGGDVFIKTLNEQFAALQHVEDPQELIRRKAAITAYIAAKTADFYREAQVAAYAKHGVAELEAQLKQMKAYEQSIPEWTQRYGSADSDETAAIRAQLDTAKRSADGSIPVILNGNSAYQFSLSYGKSMLNDIDRIIDSKIARREPRRSPKFLQ